MTGLSRVQTTRLVTLYLQGEEVKPKPYRRHRFAQRYTPEDIDLLAGVGTLHERLSGPATQRLLQRAHNDFHEARFQRLAELSAAQLYRLRKSVRYRQRRAVYPATRSEERRVGE